MVIRMKTTGADVEPESVGTAVLDSPPVGEAVGLSDGVEVPSLAGDENCGWHCSVGFATSWRSCLT